MSRRAFAVVLTLAAAACAEDATPRATLGEVCGVDEPHRVLALAPDEVLRSRPRLFAGEMFYPVAHQYPAPGQAAYGGHGAAYTESTLWASGPCGESPRRAADGISVTFVYDRWPDALLGIHELDRTYLRVDPAGGPAQVLFPELGRWSTHGLLTVGDDGAGQGALRLYPYPEDPRDGEAAPVVLLDATSAPEYPLDRRPAYGVAEDAAFIVTTDGTLLAVELPGGAVTVEQTDVREFEVSADGRYLLWQDLRVTNGNLESPEGAVFLRDRTTGEGVSLAQTWLSYSNFPLARVDDGIITLTQRNRIRVYSLPALDFVDLPYTVQIVSGPLADGRWLLQSWNGGPLFLSDLRDLATLTPFFANGQLIAVEPDGALVLDVPACCGPDQEFDEGPLWFAPFDGSAPRRVADRLSKQYRRLTDGRLLTAVDFDASNLGDLVLVDPGSGEEHLIDRRVVASGNYWHTTEDVVRYPVADGARSGVWIARMPPRGAP